MQEPKFSEFTDARDGHIYRTVTIGNQVWFAENLSFKSDNSFPCGGDESNAPKFGRLYKWNAAMDAVPEGWRLPSKEDFEELLNFVSENSDEESGTALKAKDAWKDDPDGCPMGTDEFGFCALPAGRRMSDGKFVYMYKGAHFWTSTEIDENYAVRFGGTYSGEKFSCYEGYKEKSLSVRCIKIIEES